MTEDELIAADLEVSRDFGVPRHIYENSPKFVDWRGRFKARINDRDFSMALTPSTLFINETDISAPVAQMIGSEWIEAPVGRIFHADYMTPQINGGFQIFRKADPSPFEGFEEISHTHMLVYIDASGERQFVPVVIEFACE